MMGYHVPHGWLGTLSLLWISVFQVPWDDKHTPQCPDLDEMLYHQFPVRKFLGNDPPISATQVARITGVSHQCLAVLDKLSLNLQRVTMYLKYIQLRVGWNANFHVYNIQLASPNKVLRFFSAYRYYLQITYLYFRGLF
jgi:hypothetical protein